MSYTKGFIYEDIDLAKKAISDVKLNMTRLTGKLKYELYCIPSHNHFCYYVQILSSPDKNYMIYAKTEI